MTGLTITTTDLGLGYGSTSVLEGVHLDLDANRIHGLLGRNGAGKTTLLSAIASLRGPNRGTLRVDGEDPFENERLMERICLIRESGDVLADEKISSTLELWQLARPSFDRAWADHLLQEFGLSPTAKPSALSRGQQSAFGVVLGLASRAPVTMFDEVHLGMDAPARQLFYDTLLADFAERPRTVILSSHLISEIEHLLETVTILHGGSLLLSEDVDDLRTAGATVTGPTSAVAAFCADQQVLATRELGPTRQVTLFGDLDQHALDRAGQEGLDVGPVPLQDLFIHLTGTPASGAQAGPASRHTASRTTSQTTQETS